MVMLLDGVENSLIRGINRYNTGLFTQAGGMDEYRNIYGAIRA